MKRSIVKILKTQKVKVGVNFVLYNVSWFVSILGASAGNGTAGPFFTAGVIFIHLVLLNHIWERELGFIVLVMLLGSLLDTPLSSFGLIEFSSKEPVTISQYPLWMTFLWGGFATTLSLCLKWINGRYLLGAFFGALGGPGSLYAGVKLGAAAFHGDLTFIFLVSSIEWALIIPIILYLHERIIPSSLLEKGDQD